MEKKYMKNMEIDAEQIFELCKDNIVHVMDKCESIEDFYRVYEYATLEIIESFSRALMDNYKDEILQRQKEYVDNVMERVNEKLNVLRDEVYVQFEKDKKSTSKKMYSLSR